MLKTQQIQSKYSAGDILQITDKQSPFYNKQGIVQRIGYADPVVYYYIAIDNVLTVITFTSSQVTKAEL